MKRFFGLLIALLVTTESLFAWGQKGHDVTACIAQAHLTPQAAERIGTLLEGHSTVYYANWMDNASHTPAYAYTLTWHYLNIPDGGTPATAPRPAQGDVLRAVTTLTEELKSGTLSHDEEAIALRMLIHLVGDLHCPMHTGRPEDRGGNDIAVRFMGQPTNLHAVWDTSLIEAAHRWSYTEWATELDRTVTPETLEQITAGTPEDWIAEANKVCCQIYDETPAGTDISYDYIARFTPEVEQQLLRGGLRLAALLNEIYG